MTGLMERKGQRWATDENITPPANLWRPPLLPVPWAAAALRTTSEAIMARIDDGRIRWAWEIGLSELHSLRVWTRCILTPHEISEYTPSEVIDMVIGTHKPRLRTEEVLRMLLCCRQHVLRLIDSGELAATVRDRKVMIERRSLVNFLTNRLAS